MTDLSALIERVEGGLRAWLDRRRDDRLCRRFGGIQTCPWCRQCAQHGDGWSFTDYSVSPFLDVLTCGVCGGTSLWHFGLGMHWAGPLDPPQSAWPVTPAFASLMPAHPRQDNQEMMK